jgi:REP element-mobilizing transposase RayT
MTGEAVAMSDAMREVVREVVAEVASERGWKVWAVNVRREHVHVVVTAAGVSPERVMNDLKAYATRRLRERGLADAGKVWSRHGSTRYLWSEREIEGAVHYVVEVQ